MKKQPTSLSMMVIYPNYHDCTNLGDVLGGASTVANRVTSDQYPVGEIGPKIGGLLGKQE